MESYPRPYSSIPHRSPESGFALIASLSIMGVLVMIAVALYTMSSVATRSAELASARVHAQANAKMALMMAIGELQGQMGPDQRISANAAIFDTDNTTLAVNGVNHPNWVGVWDSWVAGNPTDAPVNPDYPNPSVPSHHQTIGDPTDLTLQAGMAPAYGQKDDHFRKWLVSLDPTVDDPKDPLVAGTSTLNGDPSPQNTSNSVRLVGAGSLGLEPGDPDYNSSTDYVSAGLIAVKSTNSSKSGRYAWWVGDQSQKAALLDSTYGPETDLNDGQRIYRAHAPETTGTKTISEFSELTETEEAQLDRVGSSLDQLDLLNVNGSQISGSPSKTFTLFGKAEEKPTFHHLTTSSLGVLADVREGGLKRDLNTLLERQIDLTDSGDEFMLYKFNREGETVLEEHVPIQDLSAFYQLYRDNENFATGGREGIKYTSSELNGIQTDVPDYGASDEAYLREYTALYRNPVPIKVQFVLGVGASDLTQPERDYANARLGEDNELREEDIYKLTLGVKPVVSLWNPNNVPLVMNTDASQVMQVGFPPFYIQWKKYRATGDEYISKRTNLNYAITNESTHSDARARSLDPYIIKIRYAKNDPIIFEPGEIRTFTVDVPDENWLENDGDNVLGNRPNYDARDFAPDGFYITAKTAPPQGIDVVKIEADDGTNDLNNLGGYTGFRMVFAEGDKITIAAYPEDADPDHNRDLAGLVARANEVHGGGLQFFLRDANAENRHRNYQFISRFGQDGGNAMQQTTNVFNSNLILAGFPDGEAIPFESETNAMPGASGEGNIKSFTDAGAAKGLLMFTMMPGCELSNSQTGGFSAGRRIATRPFLHGSILSAPRVADNSPAALYDYGWEWQVEKINDTEEVLQDDGESRGYYGGSYNFGFGATHVVQQYLPVLPPISIASLSSAHLGGYSLANNAVVDSSIDNPAELGDYLQTTATGQGGLAPHTQQAIGNAYAHPNLSPDEAFTTNIRRMNMNLDPAERDQEFTYVDHSYLANKALWDDFFFSSITPQFSDVELQESDNKTAFEVAQEFLFSGQALPNRRITPYTENLDSGEFGLLESRYDDYTGGFADKIASHLMVSGPFNINSTSVEAWTVLLTSLRDKPVAYLNEDTGSPATSIPSDETPVGPGMLPNNEPILSGTVTSDPAVPLDQWTSWRSLSDTEIDQLATAIVKQVKERGPFLSLSEFINRRLDATNRELAVKGTLQAALDFEGEGELPEVSINAAFRDSDGTDRRLDLEADALEEDGFIPQFPEALDGPVAYGSTPYIDQADILRQLGSVLTPRGDTFVIRTYGDELNAQGEVIARAWCEAVVQRTPNYLDQSVDENHFTQEELSSETNKNYGRKFSIISFRWLDGDEV